MTDYFGDPEYFCDDCDEPLYKDTICWTVEDVPLCQRCFDDLCRAWMEDEI